MPDFRAYAPETPADAATIVLGPEESHHLVTVNRCAKGDPVVAFDGRGREWDCECADPARSAAVLAVKSTRQAAAPSVALTLAQALPKGAVMDDIVRQATEIGAAEIVPLLSERSQVQLDAERAAKKVAKWRTTAIEAAKQCGNPWVPDIAPLRSLADFIAASTQYELRLVASLHAGALPLKKILAQRAAMAARSREGGAASHPPVRKAVWLIGPEGDFSPTEITTALQAGFAPVSLGPLVLRSDTAAITALAVLRHELE